MARSTAVVADPRDGHAGVAVRDLGAQTGEDKLPYELDGSRHHGRCHATANPAACVSAADETPRWWAIGTHALLLAWNEYLYAFLLLSKDSRCHAGGCAQALFSADDSPWNLLMATGLVYASAGRHLLRVPEIHGGWSDRREPRRIIVHQRRISMRPIHAAKSGMCAATVALTIALFAAGSATAQSPSGRFPGKTIRMCCRSRPAAPAPT